MKSDVNVILETWKGENSQTQIDGFICISKSRKKHKKSRRHSGGIIVYIRKILFKGITYLSDATTSPNRLWIKLNKTFFGLDQDLYLCAVYIPPHNSVHGDDDFINLEAEISKFGTLGNISLIGDFNARIGTAPDFNMGELNDSNILEDILPSDYENDTYLKRNNEDKMVNSQGQNLLDLCVSSRLRVLNGRYIGDSLGFQTCFTPNGCSSIDFAIVSKSLLSSVKFFCTTSLNYLSDHVQIYFILKCNKNLSVDLNRKSLQNLQKCYSYKWTPQSKEKLTEILCSHETRNEILDFELQNYSKDESSINKASTKVSSIFENICNKICFIKKPY